MKDTRDFIIDEAYSLFLNHSYEGVSISKISDTIGLTKGALYHHFRNKEELYRAVIDEHYPISSVKVDVDTISLKEYTNAFIEHTYNILKTIFGSEEKFIPVNYFSLIADCFRHYEGFLKNKTHFIEDNVKDVEVILSNAIKNGEICGDIDVKIVALQYLYLSLGLAGDLTRNKSIESAIKSLKGQLNQLYNLLKK
jgi:TetR/AcrR family transcriptional regulator, transcriptional repressor for nem operon